MGVSTRPLTCQRDEQGRNEIYILWRDSLLGKFEEIGSHIEARETVERGVEDVVEIGC